MKRQQSGSVIFLTELLLALTIFALCSSVCARLFIMSHDISKDSGTLNRALTATQSGAEVFKRYPTLQETAQVLRGDIQDDVCIVYYDDEWKTTNAYGAAFVLSIHMWDEAGFRFAKVTAAEIDGSEVFSIDVSVIAEEAGL